MASDKGFVEVYMDCLRLLQQLPPDESGGKCAENYAPILHDILVEKQQQVDELVELEIEAEREEIKDIKTRIERLSTGGDHGTGIANKTWDVIWEELTTHEWERAIKSLLDNNKDGKTAIDTLLQYLEKSFNNARTNAEDKRKEIMIQITYPGEDFDKRKLPVSTEQYKKLEAIAKEYQVTSTPFCLPAIQEVILNEILKQPISNDSERMSSGIMSPLGKYIKKCIEFAWVACLQDPPIEIVCTYSKDRLKGIKEALPEHEKVQKKQKFIMWPAIVQGKAILKDWVVIDKEEIPEFVRLHLSQKRATDGTSSRAHASGQETVAGTNTGGQDEVHDRMNQPAFKAPQKPSVLQSVQEKSSDDKSGANTTGKKEKAQRIKNK